MFNGTKLSLADAKAGMKAFFTKGNNKQEIFNAMKQELKIKLDLFSPNDLTSAKIDNIINQIVKIQ